MYEDPRAKLQLRIASEIPCRTIVVDLEPELAEDEDPDLEETKEQMRNLCKGDETVSLATATKKELIESLTVQPRKTKETDDDDVLQVLSLTQIEVHEPAVECNALEEANPLDRFDLTNRRQRLDMAVEQRKDPLLRVVIRWVEQRRVIHLQHAGTTLSGYHRQLDRLMMEDDILYRKYYSHTGRDYVKQVCLPSTCKRRSSTVSTTHVRRGTGECAKL